MNQTVRIKIYAWLSMAGLTFTLVLASVSHSAAYGYRAYIAGIVMILVAAGLGLASLWTRNKMLLFLYALAGIFVITGFGIINGLWNHAFKALLYYLHGGKLPPLLANLFPGADQVNFSGTLIGILTLAAALFAAYFTYQFIRQAVKGGDYERQ